MTLYPYKFTPIYIEKIWGGRNLERLFGRSLPQGMNVGESWELADLPEGTSVVVNGPAKGTTLTELTRQLGRRLLGEASPLDNGRFPLLLKLLDANDILSLQVHPDDETARAIGPPAASKSECWYVLDSRDGFIYKGLAEGVGPDEFREAIRSDTCDRVVRRCEVAVGDFHYLPAGTVHALGRGVVVAEVQTPSDTTYRVTDWGRGREIHVQHSLQSIHFHPATDKPPGQSGDTLLVTDTFTVAKRSLPARPDQPGRYDIPGGKCRALMFIAADAPIQIHHDSTIHPTVSVQAGDTVLLPADLDKTAIHTPGPCQWLEITLTEA